MTNVAVEVGGASALGQLPLRPGMDEGYRLRCGASAGRGACSVSAPEAVGALRGLETLSHLAHAGPLPLPLDLSDSPRFPYRGLLVDTAWAPAIWG